MIENLTFVNEAWLWYVLGSILVLVGIFIWKEWRYYGTKRFWVQLTIIFITLFSLAMLALKPAVSSKGRSNSIIVCTENYAPKRLDSLKNANPGIIQVFYTPNTAIFKNIERIRTAFVLGEGIEVFDLWQLKEKKVSYLGDTIPSGIIKYSYDQKMVVGEQLLFKGLYRGASKEHRLVLQGAGGIGLDSLDLTNKENQAFELKTPMKAIGNYVLELIEKNDKGNQITTHLIPVEVEGETILKIAVINSFPTFESKYLKNYLAEMGHEVLVRSQLTKGRYKYEYFNTTQKSLGTFTKSNLAGYDLFIIDAKSLRNLNRSSRQALEETIREEGLGLLIQPDASFFGSTKSLERFDFSSDGKTIIAFPEMPQLKIEKHPYRFDEKISLEILQGDNETQVLAAYKRSANGRVGTNLLANTYELILKGHKPQYQQFWSTIVTGLGKRRNPSLEWEPQTRMGIKDHPLDINLRTSIKEPKIITSEGYSIAMRNKVDLPRLWKGRTYPLTSGWHRLSMTQDSTALHHYFVQDSSTWKAKAIYEKIMANKRLGNVNVEQQETIRVAKPIHPMLFYSIFLLGMAALWLLPKLLNDHSSSLP